MPKGQTDSDVLSIIRQYSKRLCQSDVPKLLMYALPGFATSIEVVVWAKNHLSNLTVEEIGEALHFPQESETESFNRILEQWLVGINIP
jgi:pimeloyl-ACP methyl ester carboxylesterase